MLLLLVLATLTVVPRVYGPIAGRLAGTRADKVAGPTEAAAQPVTPAKAAADPQGPAVQLPKPAPAKPLIRAAEPKPRPASAPATERKDSGQIQSKGPASKESAPLPIRQTPERRDGRLVPAPQ